MEFNSGFKGLIYILHIVTYFHSCITVHGFMNVKFIVKDLVPLPLLHIDHYASHADLCLPSDNREPFVSMFLVTF